MSEMILKNRWWVVVGAVLMQLCLGAIYAWSVFTGSLKDAGWTKTETQIVFSAGLATFAVVMVLAGRLMPRVGPRKLALSSAVVLGLGYLMAGLTAGTDFYSILFWIGIIGGAGIGLGYVVPIAVGMRWFPDKKGLITGLAVAGFGFGALLWVKLAGAWGHLVAQLGLSQTFAIYGIVFFVLVFLGGLAMIFPPDGWKPEGWAPQTPQSGATTMSSGEEFTSSEMLGTWQFYLIFLTFAVGAMAGLMSIGLMQLYPMEALQANGIEADVAKGIAGTAMGVFYALANGFGRIAWGSISDKIGRKRSIVIMVLIQGVVMILFQWMAGTEALLFLGATLIGFNFGGNFALFPTITAETFGTKHIGQNYGWVFLAYGVGGIVGPILGGKLGDLKNFPLAFTICGILCLCVGLLMTTLKSAKKAPAA